METTVEHKDWLKKKLRQYGITEDYLKALALVVGRTIYVEQLRMNKYSAKEPYYMIRDKEGNMTRAWQPVAELALFCKYREYSPAEYVRSLCSLPYIRRKLYFDKHQVPISFLSPSTRIDSSRLLKLENHFLKERSRISRAYV